MLVAAQLLSQVRLWLWTPSACLFQVCLDPSLLVAGHCYYVTGQGVIPFWILVTATPQFKYRVLFRQWGGVVSSPTLIPHLVLSSHPDSVWGRDRKSSLYMEVWEHPFLRALGAAVYLARARVTSIREELGVLNHTPGLSRPSG